MPVTLDLVDFAALTPDQVATGCEAAMAACDAAVDAIVAIPHSQRTFSNTLLALEAATEHLAAAQGTFGFMAYVSADDALRTAAREWDEKLDKYAIGLSFREDLYAAVKAFSETTEARKLVGEDARLLEHELRDYRRNGFELLAEERARVRGLFDKLVGLDVEFRRAISEWDDGIEVSREDLAGLPDSYVSNLKTVDGDGETKYRVSLDYPEIQPFMANAVRPDLRRQLFEKDQRKGGPGNVRVLEEALRVRAEVANLLGYDSWAAYKTETRMAKRREVVDSFLADLRARVAVKAARDLVQMKAVALERNGSDEVNIWDWRFWNSELLRSRYAIDEFEVAKFFPLDACIEGLFKVTQSTLGVRYEPAPSAPRWHPDVQAFDIFDEGGSEPLARFYMDLFPRPNKYGHAAAFTLQRGRRLSDRSYQKPVSAIVANFTKPGADQPSLLRHSEVVTFFHEFGHILHQTLTRARRARFSGTATERDFVEAPSQMLEHWVWNPAVLGSFARHYQTGAPLPKELLDSMVAAKNVNSGVLTLRQLFFATLDFAFHSPGFDGDTTRAVSELHEVTGFPYLEGTHFQSGFGHLFGYDAGYYGYLWSHVFGDDMYTRFESAGPLDPATGHLYRSMILERGGTADGDELVRGFLGREPNNEAFLRGLGLLS